MWGREFYRHRRRPIEAPERDWLPFYNSVGEVELNERIRPRARATDISRPNFRPESLEHLRYAVCCGCDEPHEVEKKDKNDVLLNILYLFIFLFFDI